MAYTLSPDGNLTQLLFAHEEGLRLSSRFPTTFMVDATYKTNSIKLPLISIVGTTCTNQTLFSAFALIFSECEMNYLWVISNFKLLLEERSGDLPTVFDTDNDVSLMSAIAETFPSASKLLCSWHVNKNVLIHANKCLATRENAEDALQRWRDLLAKFLPFWGSFHLRNGL